MASASRPKMSCTDLTASSLHGIGTSHKSGSQLVSNIDTNEISNFLASKTALDSLL